MKTIGLFNKTKALIKSVEYVGPIRRIILEYEGALYQVEVEDGPSIKDSKHSHVATFEWSIIPQIVSSFIYCELVRTLFSAMRM